VQTAAAEREAELDERTAYGQKYRIRSILERAVGQSGEIVSVWIIVHHEAVPRLVTVTPGR
jgi:hypothetical protein